MKAWQRFLLGSLAVCFFGILLGGCGKPSLRQAFPWSFRGSSAIKIIHDDDFMDDWDYGATESFEMNLAKQGVIKLLCIGGDAPPATNQLGVGCAEIFANWYGVKIYVCENTNTGTVNLPASNVPICWKFAHIYNSQNAPNSTRGYRYALANSGGNVVWVGTGLFDTLAQLLSSPPDDLSPMTGWELWSNNVVRAFFMAGDYPSPAFNGNNAEHNLAWSSLAGLQCITTLPTNVPVYWCGFTLGSSTVTLGNSHWMGLLDRHGPVWQLFKHYSGNKGRPAWDSTTVWAAIYGTNYLGSNYFTSVQGFNTVVTNGIANRLTYGSNYFTVGSGSQFYLSIAAPLAYSNSLNETITMAH